MADLRKVLGCASREAGPLEVASGTGQAGNVDEEDGGGQRPLGSGISDGKGQVARYEVQGPTRKVRWRVLTGAGSRKEDFCITLRD